MMGKKEAWPNMQTLPMALGRAQDTLAAAVAMTNQQPPQMQNPLATSTPLRALRGRSQQHNVLANNNHNTNAAASVGEQAKGLQSSVLMYPQLPQQGTGDANGNRKSGNADTASSPVSVITLSSSDDDEASQM